MSVELWEFKRKPFKFKEVARNDDSQALCKMCEKVNTEKFYGRWDPRWLSTCGPCTREIFKYLNRLDELELFVRRLNGFNALEKSSF